MIITEIFKYVKLAHGLLGITVLVVKAKFYLYVIIQYELCSRSQHDVFILVLQVRSRCSLMTFQALPQP